MFIFTKSTKELVVTTGVVISCGLFLAAAIVWMQKGQWHLIPALIALLLVAAALRGIKLGYLVTRYIWRGVALLFLVGAVTNPFAWKDVVLAGISLPYFLAINSLIALSAICLSYCLSEHGKLRKLEGAQTWRSFP